MGMTKKIAEVTSGTFVIISKYLQKPSD